MSDLIHIEEYGPAAGIDQSENPRPHTVADACNISTNRGVWETRPGFVHSRDLPAGAEEPLMLHEYLADYKYKDSYSDKVIVSISRKFYEFDGINDTVNDITPSTDIYNVNSEYYNLWSVVSGLWKYTNSPTTHYAPVLVMTNGQDPPMVYHQKTGTGTIEKLDAIDSGYSDQTCLSQPPKAKYFVRHKDRVFALNISDGGENRVYHTGPDISGAWPVNVWPASYNFDVGGSEEITGGYSFGDYLILFKRHEIWVVSGDGVDGVWSVEMVDGEHGAWSQHAIASSGDALWFLGGNAECAYRWSGGKAVNVSHPMIGRSWSDCTWLESEDNKLTALYDALHRRVIFTSAKYSGSSSVIIWFVYNLDTSSWDRWGPWPGTIDLAGSVYDLIRSGEGRLPCLAKKSEILYGGRQIIGIGGYGLLTISDRSGVDTNDRTGAVKPYSIYWFLESHNLFDRDSYRKICRKSVVYADKTGDWDMTVVVSKEGHGKDRAIHRRASAHNYIVDSANAQEHLVDGTSNFQTSASGPVDVYYIPNLHKIGDSLSLVSSSGADKIKFSATFDSTSRNGKLLVVPEDTADIRYLTMHDDSSRVFGGSGATFGDTTLHRLQAEKKMSNWGLVGRSFSMYISNVGNYIDIGYDVGSRTLWAELNSKAVIRGWGMWVRKTDVEIY